MVGGAEEVRNSLIGWVLMMRHGNTARSEERSMGHLGPGVVRTEWPFIDVQ